MRTSDLPSPQDSSGIPATADTSPHSRSAPGNGGLRITWDAGPPRLALAGDIDPAAHAAIIASLALATAADGTGRVHIDMAGVTFCDVAGMRIILHGGDEQQPAPAQVTVHNLPPHLKKLHRLLNRDPAPDLLNDTAGLVGTSTSPDEAAVLRNDGSTQTPVSTVNPPAASPPAAGSGAGTVPGPADAAHPGAVPGSRKRRADA